MQSIRLAVPFQTPSTTKVSFGKITPEDLPSVKDTYQALDRANGVMVACSASSQDPELYKLMKDLGAKICQSTNPKTGAPFFIVTGGGSSSMKVVAEGANEAGGKAVAIGAGFSLVCPELYDEFNDHANYAARFYADGGFNARSTYKVYGPGGLGTDHELIVELIDLDRKKVILPSSKKVILFDYTGFFTQGGFVKRLEYLIDNGFIQNKNFIKDHLVIADTPDDVVKALKEDLPNNILDPEPRNYGIGVTATGKLEYIA